MLATATSARRPAPTKAETYAGTDIDTRLGAALGYRIEAPDGDAGILVGVPFGGLPPQPLVLVVRDGDRMRFVSVRRVRAVLSAERRIRLWPNDAVVDGEPHPEIGPSPHGQTQGGKGTLASARPLQVIP
jgi:hypothetical protein